MVQPLERKTVAVESSLLDLLGLDIGDKISVDIEPKNLEFEANFQKGKATERLLQASEKPVNDKNKQVKALKDRQSL